MIINRIIFIVICIIAVFIFPEDNFGRDRLSEFENNFKITQYEITWVFDKQYDSGQFANGDYWVAGPVKIIFIAPACEVNGKNVINGAMKDPDPADFPGDVNQHQGYGTIVPCYDAKLNAAMPGGSPVSRQNPLIINAGSSLVSTISAPGAGYGERPNESISYDYSLKTAAILTVLEKAPPAGSFRPPYCGKFKRVKYFKSQVNYNLLKKLPITKKISKQMLLDDNIKSKRKPKNARDALENISAFFERPWLDHLPLSYASPHHPIDNMPVYGRNMSTFIGIASIMLNMDFPDEQKTELLIRFIQLGIDLYGITEMKGGNDRWMANGGHGSGRKWPILFAGIMLNDENGMKAIGRRKMDDPFFGEDCQTFYVSRQDIDSHAPYSHAPEDYTPPDKGNASDSKYNPPPYYRDNQGPQRFYPYRKSDLGMPEYGVCHWPYGERSKQYDSKHWYCMYRHVNSPAWTGFVLTAHIMGAKKLWNHDALFDYIDRFTEIEPVEKHSSYFVQAVWDTYRKDFPPVWKAD